MTRVLEGAGETRAPGERAGWPASRPTSRPSPASTTCTASRRCAGWTRSWSTTSWSSTTWCASGDYDLVVGDEAWDVDHFLHENPELKRFAYAWMTDFVGLPADARRRRARGAASTADYNAEMIEHIERYPAAARPGDLRRQPRRRRPATASAPTCPTIRDLDRAALRLRRLRHRLRPRRRRRPGSGCGASSAGPPTSRSASSPSAGPAWAATCCAGSATSYDAARGRGAGAADGRRHRPAARPRRGRGPTRAGGARLRARPLPAARRRATSRSCRAA